MLIFARLEVILETPKPCRSPLLVQAGQWHPMSRVPNEFQGSLFHGGTVRSLLPGLAEGAQGPKSRPKGAAALAQMLWFPQRTKALTFAMILTEARWAQNTLIARTTASHANGAVWVRQFVQPYNPARTIREHSLLLNWLDQIPDSPRPVKVFGRAGGSCGESGWPIHWCSLVMMGLLLQGVGNA